MPRITPIHWRKFEKFLLFVGCKFIRQRGSHRIYRRKGLNRSLVVPMDTQLPVFVVRNNLRVLNISQKEYLEMLKQL